MAYIGKYHGQFNFIGRIEEPLDVINGANVNKWLNSNNNNNFVVYNHRIMPDSSEIIPFFSQKFRGRTLAIWEKKYIQNRLDIFRK